MTGKQRFIIILILGALSTISPFSIDMYLPGFPAIARDLGTTIAQIQLSLNEQGNLKAVKVVEIKWELNPAKSCCSKSAKLTRRRFYT